MTTLNENPCWGVSRVELREARRLAEAERSAAIRQIFRALLAWRRKFQRDRSLTCAGKLATSHEPAA